MSWVTFGRAIGAAVLSTGFLTGSAHASEKTIYSYDALGRLSEANNTGTVNNGLKVKPVYDAAGNRTNFAVSGASATPPTAPRRIIVVPLNGYTIIPLPSGSYGLE